MDLSSLLKLTSPYAVVSSLFSLVVFGLVAVIIELWQLRRLTLLGKIILIKSVLVSTYLHFNSASYLYGGTTEGQQTSFSISLGQQRRQD